MPLIKNIKNYLTNFASSQYLQPDHRNFRQCKEVAKSANELADEMTEFKSVIDNQEKSGKSTKTPKNVFNFIRLGIKSANLMDDDKRYECGILDGTDRMNAEETAEHMHKGANHYLGN